MGKPRVTINQQAVNELIDELLDFAGIASREEAEEIGQAMVEEVESIVRAEFQSPDNRKINTTRLENSFTYEITGNDRDGYDVALTTRSGVSSGKIYALNYGRSGASKPYVITPRNAPRALEFTGTGVKAEYAYRRKDGSKGKYGDRVFRPYAVRDSAGAVNGSLFMERARENVLRERGYDDLV